MDTINVSPLYDQTGYACARYNVALDRGDRPGIEKGSTPINANQIESREYEKRIGKSSE